MTYSVNLKGTVYGVNTSGDSIETIAVAALLEGTDYTAGTNLTVQANLDAAVAATNTITNYAASTMAQKIADFQNPSVGITDSWDGIITGGRVTGTYTIAVRIQEKRADNSYAWGPWCKGNTLTVAAATTTTAAPTTTTTAAPSVVSTFNGGTLPAGFTASVAGNAASPAISPNYIGLYMNGTDLQIKTSSNTDGALLIRSTNYDNATSKTYLVKFKITAMPSGGGGAIPLGVFSAASQVSTMAAATFNLSRSCWLDVWCPSGTSLEFAGDYNFDGSNAQASAPTYTGAIGTVYYAQIEFTATQFRISLLDSSLSNTLLTTGWVSKANIYGWGTGAVHSVFSGKAYTNAHTETMEIMEWSEV